VAAAAFLVVNVLCVCVVLYFTSIKETRREENLRLYIYTSEGEEGGGEEDENGKEFTIDGGEGPGEGGKRRKHTDEGSEL